MKIRRKPEWLKMRLSGTAHFASTRKLIASYGLNTVCRSALCPNLHECWSSGTATFLLLGDTCTRGCRFCAVKTAADPPEPDPDEPEKIARAVKEMNLSHVVLTSVTRDDLRDGGAKAWVAAIQSVRSVNPDVTLECLIPDFRGDRRALDEVMSSAPDVLNHNVETVPELYAAVRPQADYRQSLDVLRLARTEYGLRTKSGLMVGLGESVGQVREVIGDLRSIGCDHLTIGQYLQPTAAHFPVHEYVTPEQFDEYRRYALRSGIGSVQSAPFVRSSYHAAENT
ncbi:lipoyl synthase [Prosthecochloris sp. GSB1]|uniref:lipoyl synthase n=1 Tax=Prosthecochloris sp. GSB1 TaxID=281093 RepID=UPI000B8CAE78|nr:lipoyl synthase [Prosthecochloris sp. GSB1]ASQ90516.1 lipoyl synthase [Prosthecochloris sp. GSB1]